MIVLDASVVLEVLLRTPLGDRIADTVFDPRETLHAPHLMDIEVTQAMRRYARGDQVSTEVANNAVSLLAAFPIRRYEHVPLLSRIWGLRHNLTAYDATYVALAEALGATLLTRDRRLAAAPGLGATVQLFA